MIELANVIPKRGNEPFNEQIESGSMVCIRGDYRNNLLKNNCWIRYSLRRKCSG